MAKRPLALPASPSGKLNWTNQRDPLQQALELYELSAFLLEARIRAEFQKYMYKLTKFHPIIFLIFIFIICFFVGG
jgi:hypothetical protein